MREFLRLVNLAFVLLVGVTMGLSSIMAIHVGVESTKFPWQDISAARESAAAGRFIEAADRLRDSARRGWDPDERFMQAGALYLIDDALDSAAQAFEDATAAGAPPDALAGRARVELRRGGDFLVYYRAATDASPGDPWPLAEAAVALAARGRKTEALALLAEGKNRRWVADPSFEATAALIHLAAADWDAARAALAEGRPFAVFTARGSGEFHFASAVVAQHDGRSAEARAHADSAALESYFTREAAFRGLVMPPECNAIWFAERVAGRRNLAALRPDTALTASRVEMLREFYFLREAVGRDTAAR